MGGDPRVSKATGLRWKKGEASASCSRSSTFTPPSSCHCTLRHTTSGCFVKSERLTRHNGSPCRRKSATRSRRKDGPPSGTCTAWSNQAWISGKSGADGMPCRPHDMGRVDAEELPQRRARVAAPEAVGAECEVPPRRRQPGTD